MITRRQFKMIEAGGSSATIRHGIITADQGCGDYTVELATYTGIDPELPADECDACAMAADTPTRCGELTLTYPSSRLTGTGTSVTAHDVASPLIPLVVPSDCLLVNLGDEENGSPIWQIVRGLQKHAVVYEEEGDCCDGEGETGIPTLLTVTPIIVIGHRCDTVTCGSCTPP